MIWGSSIFIAVLPVFGIGAFGADVSFLKLLLKLPKKVVFEKKMF